MPIDFRNVNSLWASVAVETLARLGLKTAIVCPGSRSTPLTYAFARHPEIEALPILDERSAAFFALGCAKRQHRPVVLVCTSGTAGANFYPAVIEAFESGVPLLVLTADRPPEMRDCASGQTIDQQKLYGGFVKHYSEMAVPMASAEMLAYLRQTLVSAWGQAVAPFAGPVHLNCPFRDPLPPVANPEMADVMAAIAATFHPAHFFSAVSAVSGVSGVSDVSGPETETAPTPERVLQPTTLPMATWLATWQQCHRGVIIAGPAAPANPEAYCRAVSQLSKALGWPVLAEGLSPLRNYGSLNEALVSTYDIILRSPEQAHALMPQNVIQLGPLPTSKALRQWLQAANAQRWIIGSGQNLDPLHGMTHFVTATVEAIAHEVAQVFASFSPTAPLVGAMPQRGDMLQRQMPKAQLAYRQQWLSWEASTRQQLDQQLTEEPALVESKLVWLLAKHLPKAVPLFVANSMPVRDVESFWPVGDRHIQLVFSRGANGIDGTLSTAMGLAHRNRPTVLLTGDLAFLHDTNGLLNAPQLVGHLTIVLINNFGGGIFEMLPISQFEPEFEKYFVTPQSVDFVALCAAYGIAYQRVETVKDFVDCVRRLPDQGMRLMEVMCGEDSPAQNRKHSVRQRKALLQGKKL